MIKLLIVDDKKIIREALRKTLKINKEIIVSGECCDGSEVIPFLNQNEINVILMDVRMPKMDGFEATRLVNWHFPSIKVIILSCYEELFYSKKAISINTSAFISKYDIGLKKLIHEIKSCAPIK